MLAAPAPVRRRPCPPTSPRCRSAPGGGAGSGGPANVSSVVGIKPTVGVTSRAGVVPISHTQDTIGPHGRTVADAAVTLGVMQSRTYDGRDPATGGVPLGWQGRFSRPSNIPADYTQFLNPNGL